MKRAVKLIGLYALILMSVSCKWKEEYDNIGMIISDLQTAFDYENISINRHWGSKENDNYIIAIFYKFPVDSLSNNQLDSLSGLVMDQIIKFDKEYLDLDYLEVKFTKENDVSDLNSSVNFKRYLKK